MAPRRQRLDAELVRRGLGRSRAHAAELIAQGRVTVAGQTATKPATGVTTDAAIVVREDASGPEFASRGGHKLQGALTAFIPLGLAVRGRRCLDAGASTGGFTDCCSGTGPREVVAVDVGYGQLAWALRGPARRRSWTAPTCETSTGLPQAPVDLVVGDLSFIWPGQVLDALICAWHPTGDLALLVKPQFEVGQERVGKGGVVRDPELRAEAVVAVADALDSRGWACGRWPSARCPGRRGTSSTSCGLVGDPQRLRLRRSTTPYVGARLWRCG